MLRFAAWPCAVVVVAVSAISSTPAEAQTLTLNSGGSISVSGQAGGPAVLTGPEGFSFQGTATGVGVRALAQCAPVCAPGTSVSVDAVLSGGNNFIATVTLGGITYKCVGCVSGDQKELNLQASGSAIVLPEQSNGETTVSGAVTLSGTFMYPGGSRALRATGLVVFSLGTLDAFPNGWTITNVSYSIPSLLATDWAFVDVGSVGQSGHSTRDDGMFHVVGSGADIWGTADAFQYAFTSLTGDGSITALVFSQQNTDPFAKAGLMLRGGLAADAAHVILDVNPTGDIEFMTRSTAGGNTTFIAGAHTARLPVALRLTRVGNEVSASYSLNNETWFQVGTTSAVAPADPTTFWNNRLLAGLAVSSHNDALNEAVFAVSIDPSAVSSELPAPWNASSFGTGSLIPPRNDRGIFRIFGSGADIWDTNDEFWFVWQPLGKADASIVTRLRSEDGTNTYAKAGVMIRADSATVILDVRPDGTVEFMSRPTTGGQMTFLAGGSVTFPAWLKLANIGDQVTGYTSQDGATWSIVGVTSLQPEFTTRFGLAATSHDRAQINTAAFDNTTVKEAGGPLNRFDWTVTATEASPGDPPRNAIDGDLNTRWSTGNAQHDNQGFIVNWPTNRTIRRIRIDLGPSSNDYARACGIWVKDGAGNVTFVNCTPDANGNVDVAFTPIPANTIEVWQWGSAPWWWSIAEFNVFVQ